MESSALLENWPNLVDECDGDFSPIEQPLHGFGVTDHPELSHFASI
jgi:hypothetical protein